MRDDRRTRVVKADDGTEAEYDRLLLCTGSNPFILPVPGKDLDGVIAYRDIHDTNTMIDAATPDTADIELLLRGICTEIARAYGDAPEPPCCPGISRCRSCARCARAGTWGALSHSCVGLCRGRQ